MGNTIEGLIIHVQLLFPSAKLGGAVFKVQIAAPVSMPDVSTFLMRDS
jgi:hypothetical protein